ncbi:MAG: hypothetical protein ACJ72N_06915 [Labedaea sp.]
MVTIPAPSSELLVNLLGLLGVVGVAITVGGLTGNWWWTLGVLAGTCVFLSVVAATHLEAKKRRAAAERPAVEAGTKPLPRAV